MADLGKAYVQIIPKAEGITNKISDAISPGAEKAGKDGGSKLVNTMKKVLVGSAIGAPIVAGVKAALDEGGKLQQSFGGLDTIYGDAADAAKAYAAEAAKAGISANDYAEQAVSFGAGLKQAFAGDTTKAVEAANTAIMDMTDNAAKMGTPIENIQNAYQGFAKSNYTMLDNLKLGYGGTKSEMERLLADAQQISGVEYDISNLGDVYDAIHVIQGELGLTGVAAQEASTTFSGSFGAMQAAGKNLLANLALGQDVAPAMKQFASSAATFLFQNLFPMIGNVIKQLPAAIGTFIQTGLPMFLSAGRSMITSISDGVKNTLPQVIANVPTMLSNFGAKITELLPTILDKGAELITKIAEGIMKAIPELASTAGQVVNNIGNFLSTNLPVIAQKGAELIKNLAQGFITNLPAIISALARLATTIVQNIIKIAPKLLKAGADLLKGLAQGLGGGALSLVKSAMNKVGNALKEPIEKAKNKVKGILDKIKGFFPLSIGNIFSNLRLPHISVSGGSPPFGIGGKGSLPHFSVQWYAKGAVFDNPSIVGIGEAGREAVVPLTGNAMKPFAEAISENIGSGGTTNNFYITVEGSEAPEDYARRLMRELQLITRTA